MQLKPGISIRPDTGRVADPLDGLGMDTERVVLERSGSKP